MRKRHKTPAHLDYIFQRKVIRESEYNDFWKGYWTFGGKKDAFVDTFVSKRQLALPFKERISAGTITFSRAAAEDQARVIGGVVRRVTKKGKFSKHGRYFRAIRKRQRVPRK